MLKEDTSTITKVNLLLILKALQQLGNGLNIDIGAELETQSLQLNQRFNTIDNELLEIQGTLVNSTINTAIESKLDLLLNQNQNNLKISFVELQIQPSYQVFASNGWTTAPQNLQAIYDNDQSTASNLFEIAGASQAYGEVIFVPNITIPELTRIQFKVGLQNTHNLKNIWELGVFSLSKVDYINIWAYFGNASNTQDLIANIEIIVPFSWDKLRFRMSDVGQHMPRARFYELKIYELKVSSSDVLKTALALSPQIMASSEKNPLLLPNLFDNNNTTRWTSGSPRTNGDWIIIDFSEKAYVSEIYFSENSDKVAADIYYSQDSNLWVKYRENVFLNYRQFVSIQARYLKFVCRETSASLHWSIYGLSFK